MAEIFFSRSSSSASRCRPGLRSPEAGIDLDPRQRLGERLARHVVALRGEERVDHVGHLAGIVLEVARHLLPGLQIGDHGVGVLVDEVGVAAMNTGIRS